jgi:hypothetical protein
VQKSLQVYACPRFHHSNVLSIMSRQEFNHMRMVMSDVWELIC